MGRERSGSVSEGRDRASSGSGASLLTGRSPALGPTPAAASSAGGVSKPRSPSLAAVDPAAEAKRLAAEAKAARKAQFEAQQKAGGQVRARCALPRAALRLNDLAPSL